MATEDESAAYTVTFLETILDPTEDWRSKESKVLQSSSFHEGDGEKQSEVQGFGDIVGLQYLPLLCSSSISHTSFPELPIRVHIFIWNYLDFSSLKSVSQTCSQFRTEINSLPLFQVLSCPFYRILYMIPFLPLCHYLDKVSQLNMRLVCKDLHTIMNFYCYPAGENYRWGLEPCCKTDSNHCTSGDAHEVYEKHNFQSQPEQSFSRQVASKIDTNNVHIYHIPTQVLKKILNYLDNDDLKTCELVSQIFQRIVGEIKLYGFKAYGDDLNAFHLMDLPTEIHRILLNLCPTNNRNNLRLVSKLMQYQVDTLAGVRVYLNDMKWTWNCECGRLPPAYSLIVANVENIQSIMYFVSDYNCMLLTRLILDGRFLPNAMICILEKCRNLKYIGLSYAVHLASLEDELKKSFQGKRLPLTLHGLKAINLKLEGKTLPSNNVFRVHSWSWTNAFELMKSSIFLMPKLTSFSLCEESIFSHNLLHEVADKILRFFAEHRHTLRYISVILTGYCFRNCDCPAFRSRVSDNTLQELRLIRFCNDCDWRISRPFSTILTAQRALQELTCYKLSDWEFYAGVISQNKRTLRSVTIEKNLAPVIDLKALSSCQNLQYLWISQCGSSNNASSIPTRSFRFEPRLANLDQLPVSIKFLHILDQTAETSQIRTIPRRLKHLETLELQFLGRWNGKSFGMTAALVSDILLLRKLNCLFLEEIRTMDAYLLNRTLQEAISHINLIPLECSQIIKNFSCILYGILVAEKLPSSDFMPEWKERVLVYFETTTDDYSLFQGRFPLEDINEWDMEDDSDIEDEEEEEDEEEVETE